MFRLAQTWGHEYPESDEPNGEDFACHGCMADIERLVRMVRANENVRIARAYADGAMFAGRFADSYMATALADAFNALTRENADLRSEMESWQSDAAEANGAAMRAEHENAVLRREYCVDTEPQFTPTAATELKQRGFARVNRPSTPSTKG